jgi:integrase
LKALRCAPAQKITEIRDAAVRGLEIRVTALGTKTWRLHYTRRSDGRRRAVSLGNYPALNDQPNRVPLSSLALTIISEAQELAKESAWLFPSARGDGPIDAHAPTRALARARNAIGIQNFRIHDLRRTAASQMAELGINPHTISMILNHVSARQNTITSKVYVQYSYARERREALLTWSTRLEAIIAS